MVSVRGACWVESVLRRRSTRSEKGDGVRIEQRTSKEKCEALRRSKSETSLKSLPDLFTSKSRTIITLLSIDDSFLDADTKTWTQLPAYMEGQQRAVALKVVNDCAERGVALMTTYNQILTKDESQKQFLLQVVENRNKLKDSKKSTIKENQE